MPKHEKGTPKEIANRCKSKGLQKLRWYCEMCKKQCRDQNGFKCHLMSESHQRQLLLFAEDQKAYLKQFSREFESNFMHILRHTFGTKRVRANEVYQEYIKDKGHIHMNSTIWHTLTGFVLYLGESGKCKVDQTEKGWHVQYIDQEEEMRKRKIQKKAKNEKDDEDRMNELLQRRIEKAMENYNQEAESEGFAPKELQRAEGEVVKFSFGSSNYADMAQHVEDDKALLKAKIKREFEDEKVSSSSTFIKTEIKPSPIFSAVKREKKQTDAGEQKVSSKSSVSTTQKRSALDEIRDEEEKFKEKRNRKDHWLFEGIIVKLITKKLGNEFYKIKGEVVEVIDNYTANVELGDGTIVKVDQNDLETVIPALGRDMLIVNGAYRNERAVLQEILEEKFLLRLKITKGVRNGRVVEVRYEDASKLRVS